MITFADLVHITQGEALQRPNPQQVVQHLLTDSRRGVFNAASLFFAIPGVRHDGHRFVAELYGQGVRQFVVMQPPAEVLPEANIVLVADSIAALQRLAAWHRRQFTLPVVGITGSNGKTIVKEWLSQLITPYEYVVKNPKSYNSQIGVPLAIWQIHAAHEVGIFEAGISQPGEMEKLQQVIQPTVGIFTNIGPAHDEGFNHRTEKIQEKARLFRDGQTIIYCKDHTDIDYTLSQYHTEQHLYTWSASNLADASLQCLSREATPEGTQLTLRERSTRREISLVVPFQDEASLENVMHCIAYMLQAGFPSETIRKGLRGLRQVNMRMELKQGIHHCYLLDDSYSNDLLSLQMGLDFLQQQKQNEKQTVILSDLLQTGQPEEELYQEVRQLLIDKKVQKLIGIGHQMKRYQSLFSGSHALSVTCFPDTETFLREADFSSFRYENILIKGARRFGFEQIVRRLQQKIHSTTLEINLDALTHNLNFYRSQLAPATKIMVMVKAFSYGGAAFEIASLLQFHQVDYLAVAYADEGVRLREHGIRTPILVLNPSPDSLDTIAAYQLEPEIYNLRILHLLLEASQHWQQPPPVHLKLDTGMHRLGLEPPDMATLKTLLKKHPHLRIASVFSHLAASDEPQHDAFTQSQIDQYLQGYAQIAEVLGYQPMRHILNSAGILRFPPYHWEMVRLGIGLYGIAPNRQAQDLRPVSTLKTTISQIKHIPKGETVGYSRKGVATQDLKIATIAIGYADGLDRGLGNGNWQVLINGALAPTIGNICMDMSMIDITGLQAAEGDEVIIFGKEPSPSVQALAGKIGTIPYEILTGIGERVKRVFYTEE